MINEHLEFKSYVTNPTSSNPRLQPQIFTNRFDGKSLVGIEDVMTLIVREFIFTYCKNEIYDDDGVINELVANDTKEVLNDWCGFDTEKASKTRISEARRNWEKDYPQAKNWLEKYIKHHYSNDDKKLKKNPSKTVNDVWDDYITVWNKSLNKGGDYRAKKISYNNIIANALESGPLKEYYLAFKKNEEEKPCKKEKVFDYLWESNERINKATKDKFLKNIATYLYFQNYQ